MPPCGKFMLKASLSLFAYFPEPRAPAPTFGRPMDMSERFAALQYDDVDRAALAEMRPLLLAMVEAALDVLRHPTVASKRFLITIGDRTVGGLSHRDQMVGPWQVPVADVAVTLADYKGFAGEAMSMGERTPLAALHAPASGRACSREK